MGASFEVEGFAELTKRLEALGRKGTQIENKALTEAAEPVLQDAKNTNLFEDRTGKLRQSLKISKVKKKKDTKMVWVGDVDVQANYSWYLEYGDSQKPPRPFLRNAFNKNKSEVFERLKKSIAKQIKVSTK